MKSKKLLPILLSAFSFLPVSNAMEKGEEAKKVSPVIAGGVGGFLAGGIIAGSATAFAMNSKLSETLSKANNKDTKIADQNAKIKDLETKLAAAKEKNKKICQAFFKADEIADEHFDNALKDLEQAAECYKRWRNVKTNIKSKLAEQANKKVLFDIPLSQLQQRVGNTGYSHLGYDDANKVSFFSRCCSHLLNYLISMDNDAALSNPNNYEAANWEDPNSPLWQKNPNYNFD